MNRYKKRGWYGESHRHYLAAKGVQTARAKPKKYYAYTPTYVAGDLPLIAGDAVGTVGAAAVPWIPIAVPALLAYGGASYLKKRKDKTGSFFAEKPKSLLVERRMTKGGAVPAGAVFYVDGKPVSYTEYQEAKKKFQEEADQYFSGQASSAYANLRLQGLSDEEAIEALRGYEVPPECAKVLDGPDDAPISPVYYAEKDPDDVGLFSQHKMQGMVTDNRNRDVSTLQSAVNAKLEDDGLDSDKRDQFLKTDFKTEAEFYLNGAQTKKEFQDNVNRKLDGFARVNSKSLHVFDWDDNGK